MYALSWNNKLDQQKRISLITTKEKGLRNEAPFFIKIKTKEMITLKEQELAAVFYDEKRKQIVYKIFTSKYSIDDEGIYFYFYKNINGAYGVLGDELSFIQKDCIPQTIFCANTELALSMAYKELLEDAKNEVEFLKSELKEAQEKVYNINNSKPINLIEGN